MSQVMWYSPRRRTCTRLSVGFRITFSRAGTIEPSIQPAVYNVRLAEIRLRILLYNPDNGVTRNFMPHLWMFLLKALTPAEHEVLLIDGNARPMDEKQLAKLVRQNAARAEKLAKARTSRKFDKTLPPSRDEDTDIEREQFFKEMRKREF